MTSVERAATSYHAEGGSHAGQARS